MVPQKRQSRRIREQKYKHKVKSVEVEEVKDSDSESDKLDNEEEGGEWITEENLYKHISHAETESLIQYTKKNTEKVEQIGEK